MGRSSKNRMKMLAALVLCVSVLTGLGAAATAAPTIDYDAKGEITIKSMHNKEYVAGGSFAVYHVAEIVQGNMNLTFKLTDPFDASNVNINAVKNSAQIRTAASELMLHISEADGIPVQNGATQTGLELGVYLVVQTSVPLGYTASAPFLVFVPMTNAAGNAWNYAVEAFPKLGTTPTTWESEPPPSEPPPSEPPPSEPPEIPTPTPTDLPEDEVPRGDIDPEEEYEFDDEEPPLADAPQTGLLQWPIPVLFSSGMIFIGCGLVTGRSKKKND